MRIIRPAGRAAAAVVATVAVVAGCGSTPAPGTAGAATSPAATSRAATSPAGGKAAAASARAQVVAVGRDLYYQHLYGSHVAYTNSIQGAYEPCGKRGPGIFYAGTQQLQPFRSSEDVNTYRTAVIDAMKADGWTLTRHASPVQVSTTVYYYDIAKAAFTGDMYILPGKAYGNRTVVAINSTCFNPGQSQDLTGHFDNVPLTSPSPAG